MIRRYAVGNCARCKGTLYLVLRAAGLSLRFCACWGAVALAVVVLAACTHTPPKHVPVYPSSPLPGLAPDNLGALK